MFKCTISGVTCNVSLLFPAVLLFLLALGDTGVALFCYCAAVLHECAHGAAMCLCHIKPRALTLSFFGMRLDMPPSCQMTTGQTVIVAAAGPLCNVCCAAVLQSVGAAQRFVAAHAVLAVLNSLPVMPLDGGQIAAAFCERAFEQQTAIRIEETLFYVTWGTIALLGIAVCVYSGGNFTLLAVAIYMGTLRLFCKCD